MKLADDDEVEKLRIVHVLISFAYAGAVAEVLRTPLAPHITTNTNTRKVITAAAMNTAFYPERRNTET
ncbi:hypothetical protein QQP08_019381 [Theobroma cacao]|nr:hypothetical protein QQP08_019381 [Theobroma cacao]